jgi:enoyl-[acyl-carrier-protein] reductase (NADH)
VNAADDEKRGGVLDAVVARFAESTAAGRTPHLRVVVHSLAFGSLLPFLTDDPKTRISRKQLEMTLDVMASSLVYWTQDLFSLGLLHETRIYALTSEGSSRVIPSYGAVSAAKSALESNCRQLAMELARAGTGCSVNAIRAGVTITPALMRIPHHGLVIRRTEKRNPSGRMTTPQDVGEAIVKLSADGLLWMTGNVISVDGGEFVTGS